jgi:putative DNA primase/helicase
MINTDTDEKNKGLSPNRPCNQETILSAQPIVTKLTYENQQLSHNISQSENNQSDAPRAELYQHMNVNGIECKQPIHFDGKIHRFSRDDKQNQRDEWYVAYEGASCKGSHYQIVIYGSWSDGTTFIFKSWDDPSIVFDSKEKEELHNHLKRRQEEAALAMTNAKNEAAKIAEEIWQKSSLEPATEAYRQYASLKRIIPYAARFGKNPQGFPSLILPLANLDGMIRSLQFISVSDNGRIYKTFLEGGEKRGNCLVLGEILDGKIILVAEGFSTACDCHRATGWATIAAFDCGNLAPVTEKLRQRYPHAEVIICADNDTNQVNNPGRSAALDAAAKHQCKVALPHFLEIHKGKKFTDFNDLMQVSNAEEVKRQIEAAKSPLNIWLMEIKETPLETKLRHHIYRLAHQAFLKRNLPEKDFIINELCKVLAPFGITKISIIKEFKQFIQENKQGEAVSISKQLISEDEKKSIVKLTEIFGPPILLNAFGEAEGINQLFFANKYAHENLVLYEPYEKSFYKYQLETGLWVLKSDDKIKVSLGHFFFRLINLLGFQELLSSRTEHLLRQLLNLLKGSVEQTDAFQSKRGVIHVGNGMIHIKDNPDHLREFSPDYFSRNRSEIILNIEAECPRFLDTLIHPAIPPDDIALLQKYCGQSLLGYNPSQTILLISGTPGGGKSTLVSIIEKTIGLHNVAQLKVGLLSERFEIASFVGKTLLTGKDVPGNFLNSPKGASVLKALVGADRLSVEQKNLKRRMEIRGEFNIIITSNARLHIRLDSDIGAWQRRLLIIEFDQAAPKKPIAHLDDSLLAEEGAGILNWMIEGAIKLLHDLEQHGRIQLSREQMQRVEGLLAESDSIRAFVLGCVETCHGSDATVTELGEVYTTYCEARGWKAESISNFENQIRNIMLEIHRLSRRNDIKRNGKSQRGFMHIALRTDFNAKGEK